jgi:hypothetical protein
MFAVRGEGGKKVKRGDWGARRQNLCWNVHNKKKKKKHKKDHTA